MAGFQDQLEELFAPVGAAPRKMFGGIGVFKDGLMFALVADDVLYLKADERTSPRFAAEGFGQWVYPGRDRPVPMPYWQVPDRLFDEPEEFAEWALIAFDVAERAKKSKRQVKPKAEKAAKKPAARKAAAMNVRPKRKPATKKAKPPAAKKAKAKTSRKRKRRRSAAERLPISDRA